MCVVLCVARVGSHFVRDASFGVYVLNGTKSHTFGVLIRVVRVGA